MYTGSIYRASGGQHHQLCTLEVFIELVVANTISYDTLEVFIELVVANTISYGTLDVFIELVVANTISYVHRKCL